MGRSATVDEHDSRAALLEARLKAWFAAIAAQPVPIDLMRHVDRLDRRPVNGFRREPETR